MVFRNDPGVLVFASETGPVNLEGAPHQGFGIHEPVGGGLPGVRQGTRVELKPALMDRRVPD